MAGNPSTHIALGSSPDSYFIGHGRRHFVENIPDSFTSHAKSDLNISMTTWISMSKTKTWTTYNVATVKFHFNGNINQTIRDHISGVNGKIAADFISFPDSEDPAFYFVKGKNEGAWTAKAEITDFDAGLTGMLFGKGKSFILMFKAGFVADLDDDEVSTEDHPLYKVLVQYGEG
ncbi:hypothetical protein B0H14DRAFT_2608270 [Mycena olivaceomarginata]|nr:hypothetical protein B0H14DRAFT_2608270 [Mycena olivaceomarginata]